MGDSPATELAVLGGLNAEPMSGYALRTTIITVLGQFWSESFGQIYPAIASLERRGLIQRQPGSRGNASVFAVTDAGRTRLAELLSMDIGDRPPRLGRLLRLYFGRSGDPTAMRHIVEEIRAEAEMALEGLAATQIELDNEATHAADVPYWRLTVSYGEHMARARAAWAHHATDALRVIEEGQTS
jgi:DNA-binding PadR family transcriptional regulator